MKKRKELACFETIVDIVALGRRWRAVEARGCPSVFLSWTWTGSWLESLREGGIPLPRLLVAGDDEAFALIGRGRAQRRLGAVPALWLNQCGDADGDRPFIEYNGIVGDPSALPAMAVALAALPDWKALHMAGVDGAFRLDMPGIRRTVVRDALPVPYVDLAKVRAVDGDYLALLSANQRAQIRRSLRDELGEPVVEIAAGEGMAMAWLEDMARLNRHRPSNAWNSASYRDFVRRLTLAGLADGSVEPMRVTTGGRTLGYLLNLVRDGVAMNYQSAFEQPRGPRSKPGLICHVAAVRHYAERCLDRYSFLAGRDRYKASLSTDANALHWLVLERLDWRLEAEAWARRVMGR